MMETTRIPLLCRQYLDHLPLSSGQRDEIEAQLAAMPATTAREAMANLHRILAGDDVDVTNPAYGSIAARAQVAIGQDDAWAGDDAALQSPQSLLPPHQLKVAPPVHRASMVPEPWGALNPLVRWCKRTFGRDQSPAPWEAGEAAPEPAHPARGGLRRLVLLFLMLGQTALATFYM
ncbi:MAG TPA: glucan biosynthesis glucosyltransferase H, partial [Oxalicibacterium sp.]|nr:glucan biosynthesis glucosyltransferase H [Oxalicibacterium sp.]